MTLHVKYWGGNSTKTAKYDNYCKVLFKSDPDRVVVSDPTEEHRNVLQIPMEKLVYAKRC